MSQFTNPTYLQNEQYRDSSRLDARIELHKRFSANPQGWFPWLWDVLTQLPTQAQVLELGCGSGAMWMACPERIPPGWRIAISDFSPGMLDSAWRNLVTLGRGFKFEQIDAQSIPYPDKTFDVVIANFMLYHVPDRPKALREICRVLQAGGTLVAATGGANHMQEITGLFRRLHLNEDFPIPENPFTLENGLAQLQPFFGSIETRLYPDHLRITEIPPLIAYLQSSTRFGEQSKAAFEALEKELSVELQDKGAIHISKDSGLFWATFPIDSALETR